MGSLALVQIEHFNGVVAQRAHEQALARCVKGNVIYSSFDSRQRDRLLQLKPCVARFSDWLTSSRNRDGDGEN